MNSVKIKDIFEIQDLINEENLRLSKESASEKQKILEIIKIRTENVKQLARETIDYLKQENEF